MFTQEFRIRTVEWLRKYIGDEDKLIFPSDNDLDIFLRNRVLWGTRTEQLNCSKQHFYSVIPGPVLDMEITSGTSGSNYRIDEVTKHVQWTSGSSIPADESTIEISYIDVNFLGTVRDVLRAIATDRSKLAVRAKSEGQETDLRELRNEIEKQIQLIAVTEAWERC